MNPCYTMASYHLLQASISVVLFIQLVSHRFAVQKKSMCECSYLEDTSAGHGIKPNEVGNCKTLTVPQLLISHFLT